MSEITYKNKDSKVVIKILTHKCISAATCIVRAPNTFELDEDGMVYCKEGNWDEAEKIIEGAKTCPTTAIIDEELDGKQHYPEM